MDVTVVEIQVLTHSLSLCHTLTNSRPHPPLSNLTYSTPVTYVALSPCPSACVAPFNAPHPPPASRRAFCRHRLPFTASRRYLCVSRSEIYEKASKDDQKDNFRSSELSMRKIHGDLN
ncbi:hypothetical protein PIB30_059449 [Stylosanthes scabra]|uniref:Uncharacterized protein n=1 Tax=Stylosanthes scabra TaxID=79078 RepID=A0ABU6XIH6_9FABA|nr:hypothetical protein [Stylosanthes scabra]